MTEIKCLSQRELTAGVTPMIAMFLSCAFGGSYSPVTVANATKVQELKYALVNRGLIVSFVV